MTKRNDPLVEMDAIYLLLTGELPDWERSFLKSVQRVTEWSPKQRAIYLRIRNKYLKKPGEDIPDHADPGKDSDAA